MGNKLTVLFLSIGAMLLIYRFIPNTFEAKTQIKLSPPLLDLGLVTVDKDSITGIFYVKNLGEETLVIDDVMGDCHCTIARTNKRKAEKNDSIPVHVKYETKVEGAFLQAVSVFSNAEKSPHQILFKGRVLFKK